MIISKQVFLTVYHSSWKQFERTQAQSFARYTEGVFDLSFLIKERVQIPWLNETSIQNITILSLSWCSVDFHMFTKPTQSIISRACMWHPQWPLLWSGIVMVAQFRGWSQKYQLFTSLFVMFWYFWHGILAIMSRV